MQGNKKIIFSIDDLEIDLGLILDTIDEQKAEAIGLQFPEGLKRQAINISRAIQQHREIEVIISGNPYFGACDIDLQLTGIVDVLFHFAHAEHQASDLIAGLEKQEGKTTKIVYIEARSRVPIAQVINEAAKHLNSKRIGVITTVQHVHRIGETCNILEQKNFNCLVAVGDAHIRYPGQVLGCNFSSARVDCDEYLYIGGGEFHPIGVAIATGKKVTIANPYTKEVYSIDPQPMIRRRTGVISKALDAESFAILVSTKVGQERLALAKMLKRTIQKHNKQAFLITMDLITPDQLLGFKVDAFVNTACPRIAIDDAASYKAPMLTPIELEIVLGTRDWSEFKMDEIREGGTGT